MGILGPPGIQSGRRQHSALGTEQAELFIALGEKPAPRRHLVRLIGKSLRHTNSFTVDRHRPPARPAQRLCNPGSQCVGVKPPPPDARSIAGDTESIPSSSIDSCTGVSTAVPCSARGHTNRPRSRRLANRHSPSPSHHKDLHRIASSPTRKQNRWPENGSLSIAVCTSAARPSNPLRRSVMPAASHTREPAGSAIIARRARRSPGAGHPRRSTRAGVNGCPLVNAISIIPGRDRPGAEERHSAVGVAISTGTSAVSAVNRPLWYRRRQLEQQVGVHVVSPGHHQYRSARLKAFLDHPLLLGDAPRAPQQGPPASTIVSIIADRGHDRIPNVTENRSTSALTVSSPGGLNATLTGGLTGPRGQNRRCPACARTFSRSDRATPEPVGDPQSRARRSWATTADGDRLANSDQRGLSKPDRCTSARTQRDRGRSARRTRPGLIDAVRAATRAPTDGNARGYQTSLPATWNGKFDPKRTHPEPIKL